MISAAALLLLTACGDTKEKKAFMRDCIRGGGNKGACECTFDRVADGYGRDWIAREDLLSDPDFNRLMANTVVQCTMENR